MGYAAGNIQVINGQEYTMYSPAWYDAMHAEAQRQAGAEGTAAGTKLANASKASGVPITPPSTGTGSTGGGGGTTGGGSGTPWTPPPRVPSPSLAMQGLQAAVSGGSNPSFQGDERMMAEPGGGPSDTIDNPSPTGQTVTGGTVTPSGGGSATGGGGYAHLAPVDTSAAESASFNKAKDQVGQESTGALAGLRSALGARGMLGSGLEERGTAAAATSAAGQLGDVSRQQAVTRASNAQKNAQANFEGDITQRGQDFQREEAANSLAGSKEIAGYQGQITQRGQDISGANAARALEIEQAQLAAAQRSTALAGLEAVLKVSSPGPDMMY